MMSLLHIGLCLLLVVGMLTCLGGIFDLDWLFCLGALFEFVGASPQCVWKTDDCDYISLLLPYTRYDQIKFDLVRNKILEQFPELLMPENCLEKIPGYGKTEDYIASIEVAYPATWTVEHELIDSCK